MATSKITSTSGRETNEPAFWAVLKTPVPAKQLPEIQYSLNADGSLMRYDSATGETLNFFKDEESGAYKLKK